MKPTRIKDVIRSMPLPAFWIFITALYTMAYTTIEMSISPYSNIIGYLLIITKCGVIGACTSGLLGFMCLNRIVFAVTFPILTILSSISCFFLISIGSGITPIAIELALSNGVSMWLTLITPKLIIVVISTLAASAAIAWYRWTHVKGSSKQRLIMAAAGCAIVVAPHYLSIMLHQSVMYRLPYSLYYSLVKYVNNRNAIAENRTTYDNTSVSADKDAPDVYFILGESLRADHLPFNGYGRNTMPNLNVDSAIISFPRIYSNVHYTHASVPRIMTDADSINPDRAYTEQSFISLFKKAGYRTAWFANQDFSDSFAYFAHETDSLIFCNTIMNAYNFNQSMDTEILPYFKTWADQTHTKPRLAIIHTIGSHWWYKSHYPDRQDNFMPEIDSHDIISQSHQQIINSYDNTILETDRFISGLIGMIRDRNAIVIYISDHGENLGEDGAYLHSECLEETLHPACFFWYSTKYAGRFPQKIEALKRNSLQRYTTDAIFHTVLDAAGMRTPVLNLEKSMLYDQTTH